MAASDVEGLRFDVIVVGAGIMGSCAAYEAASRGARVLLLDRFDLLHHRGSSHGESRTIRATYPQAHYPPMVRLARRLWDDAQRDAGYSVLTPTPHLDMGPRAEAALLAAVKNGVATEVSGTWRWAEVFRVPDGWTAAASELGGVMKATKAVAMFQALAGKKGTVVRDSTEVVDITKQGEGSILVKTSSGEEFHGAKCIITVGAWTRKLVKSVTGMDLPVQPVHTLICYWKVKPGRERELTPEAGFPTFASYGDPYIYSTPSMEFPGLIKIAMHGGPPCDPDNRDWCTGGAGLVEPVARWIDEVMPGHVETAGGPVIRQSCMYSMTPDEDYVIDFLGGEFGKDVVVGAGFSGHGFKMGPAVGRILAEMAMDGEARTAVEAGVELGHFRIGRFVGNPKGNVKDFGDQGQGRGVVRQSGQPADRVSPNFWVSTEGSTTSRKAAELANVKANAGSLQVDAGVVQEEEVQGGSDEEGEVVMAGTRCSRCTKKGHLVAVCSADVYCVICDSHDHVYHRCPILKMLRPVAHAVGYMVHELRFFHIQHPPLSREKKDSKMALITITGGELSEEQVCAQLQRIVPGKWKWTLKKCRENAFIAQFPSKSELQRLIAFEGADVKEVGVSTGVRLIFEEWHEEGFLLPKVWVKVFGIRKALREFLNLWAVGSMLGSTQMVDMESTRKNVYGRIFVAVLDPKLIPAHLDVVIGDHYFKLYFEVEKRGLDENGEEVEVDWNGGDNDGYGNEEEGMEEDDLLGEELDGAREHKRLRGDGGESNGAPAKEGRSGNESLKEKVQRMSDDEFRVFLKEKVKEFLNVSVNKVLDEVVDKMHVQYP